MPNVALYGRSFYLFASLCRAGKEIKGGRRNFRREVCLNFQEAFLYRLRGIFCPTLRGRRLRKYQISIEEFCFRRREGLNFSSDDGVRAGAFRCCTLILFIPRQFLIFVFSLADSPLMIPQHVTNVDGTEEKEQIKGTELYTI